MSVVLSKEYMLQSEFYEIVSKAYQKAMTDGTITVEKMIEELKADLLKLKEMRQNHT